MAFRTQDNLRGEVAVVTGASRGLGLLLARHGCSLVICARIRRELGPGGGASCGRLAPRWRGGRLAT